MENESLLFDCRACGGKVGINAKSCPHCGEAEEVKPSPMKKFLYIASSLLIILVILMLSVGAGKHLKDIYIMSVSVSIATLFFLTATIIGAIENGVVSKTNKQDLSKDYNAVRAKEKLSSARK